MNRRSFLRVLAAAALAPLVPTEKRTGLVEPIYVRMRMVRNVNEVKLIPGSHVPTRRLFDEPLNPQAYKSLQQLSAYADKQLARWTHATT